MPPQTFVKQYCHHHVRAYDALSDAEKKQSLACLGLDPSKTAPDDIIKYYKACLGTLKEKRGKSQGSEDQRFAVSLSHNAARKERICTRFCTQVLRSSASTGEVHAQGT